MNRIASPKLSLRQTKQIGPFRIASLTSAQTIAHIRSAVERGHRLDIAICNAHTFLTAWDDPEYAAVLAEMILLNDGIGIGLASRFLNGEGFPENLNGTDLLPRILADIETPLRLYLLGAKDEQLAGAKRHIEAVYPRHSVVGSRNGYFDEAEVPVICADVTAAKPDLLLVAMGNPRQEMFIVRNRQRLAVPVAIGVGALFDFMSGSVVRAPVPFRAAGLEWLFRLLQEPRRLFRRYVIGIPRFLLVILKLRSGRSPNQP
jgi:exopolysaccharide biosynthesis WecB/TagA/CpsF family protein